MNKLQLWDKQERAIDRMVAEPTHSILLASEQDQGKTLISSEFALRMGFKTVLFVGIKDTYDQFRERIEAQSDGAQSLRRIDGTAAGKRALADLKWGVEGWYFIGQQFFTSQDWVRVEDPATGKSVSKRIGFWQDVHLDFLCYDEVHQAANKDSNGAQTLNSTHAGWKMAMSGTFYGNSFSNAWAPTRWLWPDLVDHSYYRWEAQWCAKESPKKRNGQPMTVLDRNGNEHAITTVTGEKNPGEYVKTLPCYIRHVGKDPVPEPKLIHVQLLPEQRRMYDALEEEGLVWLSERPFVVDLPITLRSRLRTATLGAFDFTSEWDAKKEDYRDEIFFPEDSHSTKLDALWPELALYPDDKVVLGTDSKKFAKLVVGRMRERGLRAVEWSGDITTKQRDAIKASWLNGPTAIYPEGIQYIVSVTKSFSTGLDWVQQQCWRMGVLSDSDDQTVNAQWVRRVFRTGPHKSKFSWFKLVADETLDLGQYANLELQARAQKITLAQTA